MVTTRIIEIAQAVCPYIALENDSYFDEMGFEGGLATELTTRLIVYAGNAEDVPISLDENPQPRRMARYLLENVDIEILEKPLTAALLKEVDDLDGSVKPDGSGGNGRSRNLMLAIIAVVVLVLCIAAFIMLGGGGSQPEPLLTTHGGHRGGGAPPGGPGGGKGKGRWRNSSV